MKAFEFDHRLIDSYARFSRSFSTIRSAEGKGSRETRYYITTRSGAPITLAGLMKRNQHLGIESDTIIVTQPNALLARIHNRMPVIVAHENWAAGSMRRGRILSGLRPKMI